MTFRSVTPFHFDKRMQHKVEQRGFASQNYFQVLHFIVIGGINKRTVLKSYLPVLYDMLYKTKLAILQLHSFLEEMMSPELWHIHCVRAMWYVRGQCNCSCQSIGA